MTTPTIQIPLVYNDVQLKSQRCDVQMEYVADGDWWYLRTQISLCAIVSINQICGKPMGECSTEDGEVKVVVSVFQDKLLAPRKNLWVFLPNFTSLLICGPDHTHGPRPLRCIITPVGHLWHYEVDYCIEFCTPLVGDAA